MFGLTGTQKTSNNCEDLHGGFHAILSGNAILLFKTLLRASGFLFCFYVTLTNVQCCLHLLNLTNLHHAANTDQYALTLCVSACNGPQCQLKMRVRIQNRSQVRNKSSRKTCNIEESSCEKFSYHFFIANE